MNGKKEFGLVFGEIHRQPPQKQEKSLPFSGQHIRIPPLAGL